MAIIDTSKLTPQEIAKVLWDESLLHDVRAVDEEVSAVVLPHVKDNYGRLKQWTEETKDLNNKLTRKRVDTYTYYDSGEVDTITQIVTDAQDNNLQDPIIIKHYKDGRPPTTQTIAP